MWNSYENDREYLETKYLNPTFQEDTGLSEEELIAGLEKIYAQTRELPHPAIKAMGFAYILDNVRIDVNPHDWFVGIDCWRFLRNRLIHKTLVMKWQEEVYQKYAPEQRKRMKMHNEFGSLQVWPDYDHSVPDWNVVMELGFPGLLERARQHRRMHEEQGTLTEERKVYYDAIETEYSAVLRFLSRLHRQAVERSAEYPRCGMVAKCLESLMKGGATNTFEMLQLDYLYFFIAEYFDSLQVRSYGNLDVMLKPFYERDLANGTFTEEQIRELVSYFLLQTSSMHHYWGHPMYLGGTDENGETLINEVSYLILDEYDRMGIYDPKIQIKWDEKTPKKFTSRVLDMIRRGHNSFVFVCMPNAITAMMANGITEDEARSCVISGCYEMQPAGKYIGTGAGNLNMAKGVELVFHNGRDSLSGTMLGVETGMLEDLKTFDDFYQAYLRQIEFLIEEVVWIANGFEGHFLELNPAIMLSATIGSSVESGNDAYAGHGMKYNLSGVCFCNTASAIDALMAVKTLVYDNGEYTLQELKEILDADWEGHEMLRLRMKRDRKKFGNGLAEVDRYAHAITTFVAQRVNMRPNAHNGHYVSSLHCARQFIEMGKKTAASPEGRKCGEELSKNISAAMGSNWAGATALIKSVTTLDSSLFFGDFPLDVMLHPTAVQGEDGLTAMHALLTAYCERGGIAIHFNVMDVETLRDAQKHPENYQDLQVRVCGWNVLWNDLPLSEQEKYIEQAEALL